MSTRLSAVLVAALVAGSIALGVARADDKGPCQIATKGDSPTAKACASGGRRAAKKLMTEMKAQAKAKGLKVTCESCHKDMDSYELTKNARDDYKKLEAVIAQK